MSEYFAFIGANILMSKTTNNKLMRARTYWGSRIKYGSGAGGGGGSGYEESKKACGVFTISFICELVLFSRGRADANTNFFTGAQCGEGGISLLRSDGESKGVTLRVQYQSDSWLPDPFSSFLSFPCPLLTVESLRKKK